MMKRAAAAALKRSAKEAETLEVAPMSVRDVSDDILRAFREYDADGNGVIDAFELGPALQGMGLDVEAAAKAHLLANFSGGTGQLDLAQFSGVVNFLLLARKMSLSRIPLDEAALAAFHAFECAHKNALGRPTRRTRTRACPHPTWIISCCLLCQC